MKFTAAAVQLDSGAVPEENLEKIKYYIRKAAEDGAAVVVFPEKAEYIGDDYAGHAEPVPGAVTEQLSVWAKECGIYVSCSLTEKQEAANSLPCNTSVLISPDGELIGKYRKLHMFDIDVADGPRYLESAEVEPGTRITVCETEPACFGMAICYDIRFPELFRLMTLQGANVMLVPAEFTDNTGKAHWEPLLRARAIENACYVIAADQTGSKPGFQAHGNSMIIDPWGRVLARAEDRECMILAEIDTDYVGQVRREIPALHNRREDIYHLSTTGNRR